MKILVTGATGFIGSNVISALVERGHEIIGISRKTENKKHGSNGSRYMRIDATNRKDLDKLNGLQIDAIVNCLGVLGQFGLPDSVYIDTNVGATKNLLEFAKTRGIVHFVHMSSCGVVGPVDMKDCPVDESYIGEPSNIYEKSKWLAEKEVKSLNGSSVNYTIIRPEFVYGPGDLHVLGLFKAVANGKFVLIDSGKSYLHPTYIDDVVLAVTQTLFNKDSYGKTFNIVGDRYVSVRDLVNMISSGLGKKSKFTNTPSSVLMPMAKIMEASHLFADPPLSVSRVKFFTESRAFKCENAKKAIGYRPTVMLEEGIAKTIRWYVRNGHLQYNFGVSDLNISNLYTIAALEGEGWGTAYEYYSKLPHLNKAFENEKNSEVMILGLPEKYGYSMDFIIYCCLSSVKRIIVFDERKEKTRNFAKLLLDINENMSKYMGITLCTGAGTGTDARAGTGTCTGTDVGMDICIVNSWEDLKKYNVDITLSCEVLQRLDGVSRDKYVHFMTNNTRKYLIFVPNGNNYSHKSVSALRTLHIDELLGTFKGTQINDSGYVDCPPNPPGITLNKDRNKNKGENKSVGEDTTIFKDGLKGLVIYSLLSTWYLTFEKKISFVLKSFFESHAHIVFVVGENDGK